MLLFLISSSAKNFNNHFVGKYAHMWHQTEDYSLAVGVFLANSRFLLRTKSSSKALHFVANKSLLHIEAQFMT